MLIRKRILSASSGLSVRFILVAVLALLCLVVAYGSLSFLQVKQKESERLHLDSMRTADRLEVSLVAPVWNLDNEELKKELNLEMGCPDVSAIVLERMDGSFILGMDRDSAWGVRPMDEAEWRILHQGPSSPRLVRTLVNGPTAFATLYITFTDRFLAARLRHLAIQISTLTFIFFILVLVTLVALYGNVRRLHTEGMLRQMASEVIGAEERERRRIATDLHDSVGQNLAMAAVRLETLKQVSGKSQEREIEAINELIDRSIQETRTLTFQLSPPILYELGLDAALEWLLERVQASEGIHVQFDNTAPSLNLQEDSRVLLFRSVRELVHNCIKHSAADRLRVSMGVRLGNLELLVEDNGKGFEQDPSHVVESGVCGYGLFSIRERLVQMGGVLAIESAPGQGTRVRMVLPLQNLLYK